MWQKESVTVVNQQSEFNYMYMHVVDSFKPKVEEDRMYGTQLKKKSAMTSFRTLSYKI